MSDELSKVPDVMSMAAQVEAYIKSQDKGFKLTKLEQDIIDKMNAGARLTAGSGIQSTVWLHHPDDARKSEKVLHAVLHELRRKGAIKSKGYDYPSTTYLVTEKFK